MDRVVIHADANNFYAAIECLHNPKIRSLPVAVCGDIELRHGIVLAKNMIAKVCGVVTGDTIGSAKEKCPELVIVPPNMELYQKFSRWAKEICEEYADNIEGYGLDEFWAEIRS